jgi:hypothetical protein
MLVSFKDAHFVEDIILTCVRWYVAYPLSYRHVEELMDEGGVSVNHTVLCPGSVIPGPARLSTSLLKICDTSKTGPDGIARTSACPRQRPVYL